MVRLLNVEANSYMQTKPRLSGTRSMFSPYPDFLMAEIYDLKSTKEVWEGEFKTLNFGNENEQAELNESDADIQEHREQELADIKWNKSLYLEQETRAQSFTDSCFEIQNIDSFKGGQITLGQTFRLKQTVTEMYVALDSEQLYLTLREDPL